MKKYLVLLLLFACTESNVERKETSVDVRLMLPLNNNLQWLNFWVAKGAGYFEEVGLNLEIITPENPRGGNKIMLEKKADVSVMPRPMFLSLLAKEAELTAFANLLSNDPINLVVNQNLIKDIDSLNSLSLKEKLLLLKGKTIGVASGPVSRLNKLFEVANIKPDSLFQIKIISGKEQNQAFAEGQVDALYAHTPYLEKAITENNGFILINQSAGEVPEMANRHIHLMVAQKDFIKNNPETISKICEAIYKAQKLVHSDKQAALEAIRKSEIKLQAPNALEILFDIYEPAVPKNPEVFGEILVKELDLFPSSREIPQLDSIAIAKNMDNTFAQKAVQSLKTKE